MYTGIILTYTGQIKNSVTYEGINLKEFSPIPNMHWLNFNFEYNNALSECHTV